jgi:hypothetical protein
MPTVNEIRVRDELLVTSYCKGRRLFKSTSLAQLEIGPYALSHQGKNKNKFENSKDSDFKVKVQYAVCIEFNHQ